jgi:hypothetical protein
MPVPKYLSLLLPDGQDEIVHVCAPDEVCIFNRRKNYTLGHEKKNQPTDPILSITSVWFLFTGGGYSWQQGTTCSQQVPHSLSARYFSWRHFTKEF